MTHDKDAGLRRYVRQLALVTSLASVVGCYAPGTAQNVRGVQYFQGRQPQAAMQQFEAALVQNPRDPDAYYNLAASYHYLGKHRNDTTMLNQAENLYHQCLDLNADHVACHRALAVLLVETDRPQSAFTLLERWAARSPHVTDARVELARLHEEFGEPDMSQRYLADAIDVDPSNSRAWAAMAHLREQEGRYAQALTNYQQAYYLNNYQPGVPQRIAQLHQRIAAAPAPRTAPNSRYVETPRGWRERR